jgi:hypothetical protein
MKQSFSKRSTLKQIFDLQDYTSVKFFVDGKKFTYSSIQN